MKRRIRRSIIMALSLVLVLVLGLAACGNDAEETTANGNAAETTTEGEAEGGPDDYMTAEPHDITDEEVAITLWSGYPELDEWFAKCVTAYKTEHPNVSIEIASFPLRDFEKKVATALPADSSSEIITINPSIALRYIQEGLILKAPNDLDEFVKSGVYPEAVADDSIYEGVVYGIPHMMSNAGLFYNTDMFEAAGLTDPPQSMDELIDYAQQLTQYDDNGNVTVAGLALRKMGGGSGTAEKFWTLLMQNGSTLIEEVSPGKWQAAYNDEGGVKTLQMYVDMLHKYKTDSFELEGDSSGFEAEQAAMFIRETWVIADIEKNSPDLNYDTAPLFSANMAVEKDYYVTNSAEGDKAAVAWDFIRFLMEPDNHVDMVKMSGWHPARNDLDLTELFAEKPQYEAFFAEYETVRTYPMLPEYDEIQTKLAERLMASGFPNADFVDNPDAIQAFLDECAVETNDILKENGHLAE